jgi:hypothetical protein
MAVTTTTTVPVRQSAVSPTLVLVAGWLVPGLGHVLVKKPIRAALLFVSIVSMFFLGMMMHGKVYSATNGDMLDLLGFVGEMGSPLLYVIAHAASMGGQVLTDTISDYGSKFAVVAGLLNVMAAVDAQSLANGRKESL